jgi:hypothetical protein
MCPIKTFQRSAKFDMGDFSLIGITFLNEGGLQRTPLVILFFIMEYITFVILFFPSIRYVFKSKLGECEYR